MDADEDQIQPPDGDEETRTELFNRPSSLPDIGATMRGFSTEDDAREVGNTVLCFLRILGTFFDLGRLGALTIAYDYDDALAQIERGFETTKVLTATHDDLGVGIAMAVPVIREGQLQSHLVINAAVANPLRNLEDPASKLALYMLAHEAAHVHDQAVQDRAFPGLFGKRVEDYRDAILFNIGHGCWEEFIASKLSATFAPPEQIGYFASTFCSALESAQARGNAAIIAYRRHRDVNELVTGLTAVYKSVLVYASYLLGHLSGLEKTLPEAAPTAHGLIDRTDFFRPVFQRLKTALETMHATYGQWSGLEVFEPLKQLAEALLNVGGMSFRKLPTGHYWVDVPYSPETMPATNQGQESES